MTKTRIIIMVSALLAAIFVLSACSVQLGGPSTWEYTADNKEGAVQLYNDFFEETFADTNQVVVFKNKNGNVVFTENIEGTSDHMYAEETKTHTYSFIDGERYISATSSEDGSQYYMEGKDAYNNTYFGYKTYLSFMTDMPDEEVPNYTISCVVKGEEENGHSTSTMEYTITSNKGEGSIVFKANAKDGLVQNFTYDYTYTGEEGTDDIHNSAEFTYGNASVGELPDITDWYKYEM